MVINGTELLLKAPIKGMFTGKFKGHGVSYGLSEAGYDICIKQEIQFTRNNVGQRSVARIERDSIGRLSEYDRTGGSFVLASAIEEFQMPEDMIGIVHDKSSWARRGLSVFNTVIEPGWEGFLTLELVYHGNENLIIPAGAGIAQVIFHRVAEPTAYHGKYQNQADMPVPAIAS
jgi:dCTP deaminase